MPSPTPSLPASIREALDEYRDATLIWASRGNVTSARMLKARIALEARLMALVADAERKREEFRQWANENVKRNSADDEPERCHCMQLDTCVECAYRIGRSEGQMDAGAHYTHAEVFAVFGTPPEDTTPHA